MYIRLGSYSIIIGLPWPEKGHAMSNKTQLQENNIELQGIIDIIQELPEAIPDELGSAITTDVLIGKTFTSDSGIMQQGGLDPETLKTGIYVWKKLTAEGGDFVDFVVNDTETAYPDGGTQDGYWYEKVSDGIPLSVFESSKYAIDTFTLTSDTKATNYSISHSLGSTPKFVFLKIDNMPTGHDATKVILNFVYTAYLAPPSTSGYVSLGLAAEFYPRDSSYSYEDREFILSNTKVTFKGAGFYRAGHVYALITVG